MLEHAEQLTETAEPKKTRLVLLERSEGFAQIATALAKAQGEFPPIEQNCTAKIQTRNGGLYSYDYADLAAIREAVAPALAKHGLALVQAVGNVAAARQGPEGGTFTEVSVQTELIHESGEWFRTPVLSVVVEDEEIKEIGIATTYFRRYQVQTLLGIAPEQDKGAEGQGERKSDVRSAPPAAGNFRCRYGDRHPTAQSAKECQGHAAAPDRTLEPGQDPAAMSGGSEDPAAPDTATVIRAALARKDWQAALPAITAMPPGALKEQLKSEYQAARHGGAKEGRP